MSWQSLLCWEALMGALGFGFWIWLRRIRIAACICAVRDVREEARDLREREEEEFEARFQRIFCFAVPRTGEERLRAQPRADRVVASATRHEDFEERRDLASRAGLFVYRTRGFYLDLYPPRRSPSDRS